MQVATLRPGPPGWVSPYRARCHPNKGFDQGAPLVRQHATRGKVRVLRGLDPDGSVEL